MYTMHAFVFTIREKMRNERKTPESYFWAAFALHRNAFAYTIVGASANNTKWLSLLCFHLWFASRYTQQLGNRLSPCHHPSMNSWKGDTKMWNVKCSQFAHHWLQLTPRCRCVCVCVRVRRRLPLQMSISFSFHVWNFRLAWILCNGHTSACSSTCAYAVQNGEK